MRVHVLLSICLGCIVAAYTPQPRVELFTSKACRACRAFDKRYSQLVSEFPTIDFEKHELYGDDNIQRFKDNKITAIPCMLFFRQSKEVNRLLATQRMVPDIEEACLQLSSEPKERGNSPLST